jgi:mannosidase alpha-like ER degradation enhancer 2
MYYQNPIMKTTRFFLAVIAVSLLTSALTSAQPMTAPQKRAQAEKVKAACTRAWSGYKQYAWGYDALQPITKKGHNWYGTSLLMTPVDAFDTFVLLGLKREAKESKDVILSKLNFNVNADVQFFEVTIRLLGGLLSAYELDGDKRFLRLAEDLGKRLMPAFASPTGMPYRYVHLQTGRVRDSISNPAEIGTCLLEFGKLSQCTGDSTYFKAAKKATLEVFKRRSKVDLVGTMLDVTTGEWTNSESHVSGRIDSYYEYLYKAWLLFGDKECKAAWETSAAAVKKYLLQQTPTGSYYTRVDMNSGKETRPFYGALDAFYAGLAALSGDVATAKSVQTGNFYMWTHFGIEPERFNFRTDSLVYGDYPLRPENIESCFYLYRITKDDMYVRMGKRMVDDILEKCKTEVAYAAVKNVATMELDDSMESFFFAETLKYAYLLFAPETALNLKKVVFNTEAHPLKITSR